MYKREHIDLTYVAGKASREGLKKIIEQALVYKPRGLCLSPVVSDYLLYDGDIYELFEQLPGAGVLRQFVIDFPLGQGGVNGKFAIAEYLVSEGIVDEFGVVANIGAIIEDNFKQFSDEIRRVMHLYKPVKVIVETGYYAHDEETLRRVVHWCAEVGAFAIKTSTGDREKIDNNLKLVHVAIWKSIILREGYNLKIEDSGGKKTREDIDNSLLFGADIIGTSSVIL